MTTPIYQIETIDKKKKTEGGRREGGGKEKERGKRGGGWLGGGVVAEGDRGWVRVVDEEGTRKCFLGGGAGGVFGGRGTGERVGAGAGRETGEHLQESYIL